MHPILIQVLFFVGLALALLVVAQASLLAAERASLLIFGSASRFSSATKQRVAESQILAGKLMAARAQLAATPSMISWSGNRKFRIERKVRECADICSFYLVPDDKKALPAFRPGQYLTFDLEVPGQQKRLVRCYSLSDRPQRNYYRITVKRLKAPAEKPEAPAGIGSNLFHDHLKEGDVVDARAPSGSFFLETTRDSPVVLIGGGVGITPLLSMLNEIVETESPRETWLFLGVRNRTDHAFREQIQTAILSRPNIRMHVCYSRPGPEDSEGTDYHHAGRISTDLLKMLLPSKDYDFFLCGPGGMMESIRTGLREWNVPEQRIHLEAFGPASVKKTSGIVEGNSAPAVAVHFSKSGRKLMWQGEVESLLDLAIGAEIPIDFGCRAGSCGTCKVTIKSGRVKYLKEPGYQLEAGMCLACCSVPDGELALDA